MQLCEKHCGPIAGGKPLELQQAQAYLAQLQNDWQLDEAKQSISFDFTFNNFHETMAFVNALAWVAHQQDHHPDIEVGYKHCLIHYSTHSVGGLSVNDFICAARIEQLLS